MMIKKYSLYLLLFCSCFLFTGCFEILEEINLNKDGSGTFTLTLNLSKSKTKLASVMLLDTVNGYAVPSEDDIKQALKDVEYHMKQTQGISNIAKTSDFDNYIFSVSCDFSSLDKVNNIFKELITKQNKKEHTQFTTTHFTYKPSEAVFQRHFKYDGAIKKTFNSLKSEDKKVFDDASYTCIYRFKDEVSSVSNSQAKVSPNKKAVLLKVEAMSLILGERSVQNTINLSK